MCFFSFFLCLQCRTSKNDNRCLQDDQKFLKKVKVQRRPVVAAKSKRVTASEGLVNVANSMENSMQTLANSLFAVTKNGETDVSARKAAAISAIEEDESLSENEFNDAVEMIMNNPEAANMYL